jgi:hypothetical protein
MQGLMAAGKIPADGAARLLRNRIADVTLL